MKYLLFVNQLYSYSILRPLQDAIRARGDSVAWFIYDIPNLLTADDANEISNVSDVKKYNPDAVFVPTNWVPDFFPGIKVEIFHGFNVVKRADFKRGHFRIRGHFDLYCTQGPDTTAPFQALAKEHGFFRVVETGWSKLDPMFKCPNPNQLREELNTDKKIIFYASTFSKNITSAPVLADSIRALASTGRWHWVITLHPKMAPDIIDLYRSMQSENISFIEPGNEVIPLLHAADAMLCDTSSILVEYLLLNKPVVTYNTTVPGPHLLNITESNQLENALETALQRPEKLMNEIREYCERIHPCRDGMASQRILDATEKFINSDKSDLKRKPWNIIRKLQMRMQLKYYWF